MFLKSNKSPHTLSPYRSIQLTPTLSKVLEKNVVRRLHNHLRDHNLLPPYQAGFRSKYSINIQLLRLTSLITNHFNKSQPSCLMLFDLEKAFDKVWHEALLYKLISFRLPLAYTSFTYSFLTNRLAYKAINATLSHSIFLHSGVPQGFLHYHRFSMSSLFLISHPSLLTYISSSIQII